MRFFKKIVCHTLIMAFLLSFFLATPVFAADADMRYGRKMLGQMSNGTALQYAYDQLVDGLQEGKPDEISLSHNRHRVSKSDFTEHVFPMFYADYPEFFWLKNGGYTYQHNADNIILSIRPAYVSGFSKLSEARSAYNNKVNQLTSDLTGSDYDKAKTLHDRLCDAVDYVSTSNDQNAYGALVEGKAVCAGYARAYQHLLLKAGIPAWYVRGSSINPSTQKSESHGWNLVKLDGQWYYTDVTWDDQRTDTFYTYFNITTQQLKQTHICESRYADLVPNATATAANYFAKEDLIFSDYDQDRLVDLLKQNGNKVQIYIEDGPDDFLEELDDDLLSLGKALGGTGAFKIAYSVDILGNAIILEVTLKTEGHTHSAANSVSAVEASCLASGKKAYYTCDCGIKFLDQACTKQVTDDSQLVIPPKEHTPSSWKNDAASHWKICVDCNSGIANTKGAHTDSNADRFCDVCSYSLPAEENSGSMGDNTESTPPSTVTPPTEENTPPTQVPVESQPSESIPIETPEPEDTAPTDKQEPDSGPAPTDSVTQPNEDDDAENGKDTTDEGHIQNHDKEDGKDKDKNNNKDKDDYDDDYDYSKDDEDDEDDYDEDDYDEEDFAFLKEKLIQIVLCILGGVVIMAIIVTVIVLKTKKKRA